MTDAQIAEIQRLTADLQTTLGKLPQDYIRRDEIEKMVSDLILKVHPKAPQMVLPQNEEELMARFEAFKKTPKAHEKAAPWLSEYGKKFGDMQTFIKAVAAKGESLKASSDAQTEGTGSTGGYLVPTEFSNEVITLLRDASIIRGLCRMLPMSSWKRTMPTQLTNVVVTWPEEFGAKAKTKTTFGQLTQQAKVMAAIIKCSDEIIRDSAINLQSFLAGLVAEAMGLEEERVALVGTTASDPFNGVYYASGVVAQTMAAAKLSFDDVIDLETAIAQSYRKNGVFVMATAGLKLLMKLKDTNGQFIWHRPEAGAPGTINGKPYEISDQIPSTLGTGAQSAILFGDFRRYLMISDRAGITVKVSQDASDWVSGALDSSFMTDQTWLRFTRAESIDVLYGAAFARLPVA